MSSETCLDQLDLQLLDRDSGLYPCVLDSSSDTVKVEKLSGNLAILERDGGRNPSLSDPKASFWRQGCVWVS